MRGDFGPAPCPVCGTLGARALMADHLAEEHPGQLVRVEDVVERLREADATYLGLAVPDADRLGDSGERCMNAGDLIEREFGDGS